MSFLNAASNTTTRSIAALMILDHVSQILLPALQAQAEIEAQQNFVGTFVSSNGSLNSSITISFNESTAPGGRYGLSISKWISNGTDVIANPFFFGGIKPKLLPTIIDRKLGSDDGKVAFASTVNLQLPTYEAAGNADIGPFLGFLLTNQDWAGADRRRYAEVPLNLLVFDVDTDGRATTVSPVAWRVTLDRK